MDAIGLLDTAYDEVDDSPRPAGLPSLQLVGSPERRTLDLNSLTDVGIELVGRLVGISDGRAQFSGSLASVCADADLKMGRLLDQIDEFAGGQDADRPGADDRRPRTAHIRPVERLLHSRVGHRFQAQLPMARQGPVGPQGSDHSRRRRDDAPRALRARAPVHREPGSRSSSTASAPTLDS